MTKVTRFNILATHVISLRLEGFAPVLAPVSDVGLRDNYSRPADVVWLSCLGVLRLQG